jgi:CRISPR-associated endonuclease/helicase Cas3
MKPADFEAFFQAIHSRPPFPWQTRLARLLCETNAWPAVLDLPTGTGKTSCLDIALFHWLVAAARGEPWQAARRIALVVDRRIIVDEASARARAISAAIQKASGGVLGVARDTLLVHAPPLAGDTDPLVSVFTLRGGVARERNLVRDPLRLSFVLSTVDQIGSRLLFRGYGVSDGMSPLHAGMFGTDTLLLLDEAHIAAPFRQTLEGIVREQGRATEPLSARPLRWAQLTATPGAGATTSFSLAADDREHPILRRRLSAKKPMRLLEVAKRDELVKQLAELVTDELALPPLADDEQPRIGIVVNRVQTARSVFDALKKALKDRAAVELCIGRTRPLDRDAYMSRLTPALKSSEVARPGEKPIVVVATQTIEVGADFDFHSMFIEAADYSAMKQRVGRLNRLGIRHASRGAIVLVRADAEDDPIYGKTIAASWALLQSNAREAVVEMGIEGAPEATPATRGEDVPTPFLSPSLLGLLVQTSPRPAVEPAVSEFLHGFARQVPDVSVVWRDGIADREGNLDVEVALQLLEALPPASVEAMSLPFGTFRQWASGWGAEKKVKLVDGGDLEGDAPPDLEAQRERNAAEVLTFAGGRFQRKRVDEVRPGALVVVPTSVGGADEYGFRADDSAPVPDLCLAARQGRAGEGDREAVLVWTRSLAQGWLQPSAEGDSSGAIATLVSLLNDPEAGKQDWRDGVFAWFDAHLESVPSVVRQTFERFGNRRARVRLEPIEREGQVIGLVLRQGRATADDIVEGAGLQRTVRVNLVDHLRTVGELAERFARGAGLAEAHVVALRLAGAAHDLGKADPRFQRRLRARAGELLAKSDEYDDSVRRGERHEVYSVAVLDAHPRILEQAGKEAELVRYLVGTHHGYGRGLHPPVEDGGTFFEVPFKDESLHYDGQPAMSALDSGWADLFVSMNRRYGPWGLSFLESILRLADHRRSELEVHEAMSKEDSK